MEDEARLHRPCSCDEYLELIYAIGYDYDGCEKPESLKELIDELVELSTKARECLHEGRLFRHQESSTTHRTGTWVKTDNHRWKCSSCGKETDLPHHDAADFCFACGAKMKEENN